MNGKMTLDSQTSLLIIFLTAGATVFTRALPFLLFPSSRKKPRWLLYLGRVLPPAVIGMLLIYCLKGVTPLTYPFGLPELLSVLCTIALHVWKRNTFLSIASGTILYMILIRFVFL